MKKIGPVLSSFFHQKRLLVKWQLFMKAFSQSLENVQLLCARVPNSALGHAHVRHLDSRLGYCIFQFKEVMAVFSLGDFNVVDVVDDAVKAGVLTS